MDERLVARPILNLDPPGHRVFGGLDEYALWRVGEVLGLSARRAGASSATMAASSRSS